MKHYITWSRLFQQVELLFNKKDIPTIMKTGHGSVKVRGKDIKLKKKK